MKCLACGKEASGSVCKHCQFPVIEIVGNSAAEVDESIANIQAHAQRHREEYLEDLRIGVMTYKWKEAYGRLVEDFHVPVYFAKGSDLRNGEVWYPEQFAAIPNAQTMTVKMVIMKGASESETDVQLPNPAGQGLQKVGFRLDDQLQVRMLLKNESGQSESQPISVAIG